MLNGKECKVKSDTYELFEPFLPIKVARWARYWVTWPIVWFNLLIVKMNTNYR